jgi:hypothetical protein
MLVILENICLKCDFWFRSPGGTPCRRAKSDEAIAGDPGTFMAMALRKKFGSVTRNSTGEDTDSPGKENDFNSSWDSSPERKPPAVQPKVRCALPSSIYRVFYTRNFFNG